MARSASLGNVYLDTSAVAKLLVAEPESKRFRKWFSTTEATLISSQLLETELRRVALRFGQSQSAVTTVLGPISLVELPPTLFFEAGVLGAPTLRSLDALHLASALRSHVDTIVTYDDRMGEGAESLGLRVFTP